MKRNWSIRLRIVAIPVLVATIAVLQLVPSLAALRGLTFLTIFLLLVDLFSLSRAWVRDTFLVFASLAFGLGIAELVASIVEPKASVTVSDGFYTQEPILGWRPGHAGRYHAERIDLSTGKVVYNVDYTIDDALQRQMHSAASGPAIVFFGDSVTFGIGINDSDTLPQQFSDRLDHKVRVLNLAVGGYGPPQFLRILQDGLFQDLIGPDPQLFVFLTSAWHAERTACKSDWTRPSPRFLLRDGKLSLAGSCADGQNIGLRDWLHGFASYRMFIEPLVVKPTDADVELYIRTLVAAVQLAKERYGTRVIIPYLASHGYLRTTRFTDESVIARLREGGAIVIDASLQNEEKSGAVLAIPGDGHPTPLANKLRAALLADYIERNPDGIVLSGLR